MSLYKGEDRRILLRKIVRAHSKSFRVTFSIKPGPVDNLNPDSVWLYADFQNDKQRRFWLCATAKNTTFDGEDGPSEAEKNSRRICMKGLLGGKKGRASQMHRVEILQNLIRASLAVCELVLLKSK